MRKNELKRILKKHLLKQMDIDEFIAHDYRDTFCDHANNLTIHVGRKLTFCIDYSSADLSGYCADGNCIISCRETAIYFLMQFLDCKITEKEIIDRLSGINRTK